MSEALYDHYREELFFIRKLAQEFRQRYPAAAARLQLEENRSADPHVERLIEAFALLTARTQLKIHDEFPELTDALLHVLYPHLLAPIPSLAMMQFHLPAAAASETGVKIPGGLNAPPGAIACLRLRLHLLADLTFDQIPLDKLRFYLHGDPTLTMPLYELLFNHALQVVLRPVDIKGAAPIYLTPQQTLAPVGFELDEGLLPYPSISFPGYRLLTEFFAFPQKFLFADLLGWDRLKSVKTRQVEFIVFLNRTLPRLEQKMEPGVFRLGCTPLINLFDPPPVEPFPLNHRRAEYRLEPDISTPDAFEIYNVNEVSIAYPDGTTIDAQPFYGYRHGGGRENRTAFWYMTRKPALRPHDHGTDVFLHLVDLNMAANRPADGVVIVKATCSNRDLPNRLPRQGEEIPFDTEFAAPGVELRCLISPTPPQRPPLRRGMHWRLVSQLSLNHLSIAESGEGTAALQEILRLYDFTDPDTDPQLSATARLTIDGITDVRSRRTSRWSQGTFCRGVETTVSLDEKNFLGTSMLLFSAVLDRFLGLYVHLNSFSELVVKIRQREGEFKRWPPRAGVQSLL
jgi:type VI secretion system protein ImpG